MQNTGQQVVSGPFTGQWHKPHLEDREVTLLERESAPPVANCSVDGLETQYVSDSQKRVTLGRCQGRGLRSGSSIVHTFTTVSKKAYVDIVSIIPL